MNQAPAITPGKSSTEFKVTLAALGVSALVALSAGPLLMYVGPWYAVAAAGFGALGMSIASVGYSVARGRVKAAAATTVIVGQSRVV